MYRCGAGVCAEGADRKSASGNHSLAGTPVSAGQRVRAAILAVVIVGGGACGLFGPNADEARPVVYLVTGHGVTCTPVAGEYRLETGQEFSYNCVAGQGYQNLKALRDSVEVTASGSLRTSGPVLLSVVADTQLVLSGPEEHLRLRYRGLLEAGDPVQAYRALQSSIEQLSAVLSTEDLSRRLYRARAAAFDPLRDAAALADVWLAVGTHPLAVASTSQAETTAGINGMAFAYVNGIRTTRFEYDELMRNAVPFVLADAGYADRGVAPLIPMYNPTARDAEAQERRLVACQASVADELRAGQHSTAAVSRCSRLVGDVLESLRQYLCAGYGCGGTLPLPDVRILADAIRDALQVHSRLVLISHSQGSLVIEAALPLLPAGIDRRCIGVVAVAPPRVIPPLANGPSVRQLIIRGAPSQDILLQMSLAKGVPTIANELSDEYDALLVPWKNYFGTGPGLAVRNNGFDPAVGVALHSFADSYLAQPSSRGRIIADLAAVVNAVSANCGAGPSAATLRITSNIPASWTLQPGALAGAGTNSTVAVAPSANGTGYTLQAPTVPGYQLTVSNSDGSGSSLVVWPGQAKSFELNYVLATARPVTPATRIRSCPSVIETGVGVSHVEVFARSSQNWLPGAQISLSALSGGGSFGLPSLGAPAAGPATTTFTASTQGPKQLRALVSANGGTVAVDTTVYASNRTGIGSVVKVSGDNQVIPIGTAGQPRYIEVRDAAGLPINNVAVGWQAANCFYGLTGVGNPLGRSGAIFVPPYIDQPYSGITTATVVGPQGPVTVEFYFRYIDPANPLASARGGRGPIGEGLLTQVGCPQPAAFHRSGSFVWFRGAEGWATCSTASWSIGRRYPSPNAVRFGYSCSRLRQSQSDRIPLIIFGPGGCVRLNSGVVALVLVAVLASCDSGGPSGPSNQFSGTFSLRMVGTDGSSPFVITDFPGFKYEVLEETLRFTDNGINGGSISGQGRFRTTVQGVVQIETFTDVVPYFRQGLVLTLGLAGGEVIGTGVLSGNTLTLEFDGIDWVYKK